MLSKNNNRELQRKIDDKQDRFTLRKLSIGVASVLLGSFIMGTQSSQTAYASNGLNGNSPTKESTSTNPSLVPKTTPAVPKTTPAVPKTTPAGSQLPQTGNQKPTAANRIALRTYYSQPQTGNQKPTAANGSGDSQAPNTQQASITDASGYPKTNGIVPQNQYIFDQFHLTNGQPTDNNTYTPLDMVITLATNRNEPGGILNYYITNDQYTQQYSNGTINVGEMQTYEESDEVLKIIFIILGRMV